MIISRCQCILELKFISWSIYDYIQVLAYTGAGDGRFSAPVSCSTEEDGRIFNNSKVNFFKINHPKLRTHSPLKTEEFSIIQMFKYQCVKLTRHKYVWGVSKEKWSFIQNLLALEQKSKKKHLKNRHFQVKSSHQVQQ